MTWLGTLLLSLALAVGPNQAKPDFSGKWTKIAESPGDSIDTMTISQTSDTLTIDTQSPDGVTRWVLKLDGSESRNVVKQARANPPIDSVQVSRTKWEGETLVTRTAAGGGYVLATVLRLDGATLVVQATRVNEATGAVLEPMTLRYSK